MFFYYSCLLLLSWLPSSSPRYILNSSGLDSGPTGLTPSPERALRFANTVLKHLREAAGEPVTGASAGGSFQRLGSRPESWFGLRQGGQTEWIEAGTESAPASNLPVPTSQSSAPRPAVGKEPEICAGPLTLFERAQRSC